jgi:hypothetical protein
MDGASKRAFLALVLAQAAHSLEEFAFRFYEVFPPARALNELVPGITRPGFVVFNTLLVIWGLWCFFARVRPGARTAVAWAWAWIAIELFNGLAHPTWSALARGYRPGLFTAPLLLGLALFLAVRLRRAIRAAA